MAYRGITPFRYNYRVDLEKWQWAWLAGIFEGEGSISFTNARSAQVKILMTDRDVIETIENLVPSPRGIVSYEYPHKKTQWKWQLSGRDDVRFFLHGVYPFLHARRRQRVDDALGRIAESWGDARKRTHCPRGHPLSGENLYTNRASGGRSCLECRRQRDLARNARQKEERRIRRERRREERDLLDKAEVLHLTISGLLHSSSRP